MAKMRIGILSIALAACAEAALPLDPSNTADLLHAFSVTVRCNVPAGSFIPHLSIKRQPIPEYPPEMRVHGICGVVVVRVTVDGEGLVRINNVVRVSQAEFLPSVEEAIEGWLFVPAVKRDKPVETTLDYTFKFNCFDP